MIEKNIEQNMMWNENSSIMKISPAVYMLSVTPFKICLSQVPFLSCNLDISSSHLSFWKRLWCTKAIILDFKKLLLIIHLFNFQYNFFTQNCPQNSDGVKFDSSPWIVYPRPLKEHKAVLCWSFEDRNDVRLLKLSQIILAWQLIVCISV